MDIEKEFTEISKEHSEMKDSFNEVSSQHDEMIIAFKKVEKQHDSMNKELSEIKNLLLKLTAK